MRQFGFLNPIEWFTGARPVISTDHEYIHDGKAFRFEGKTASIPAGGKAYIAVKTPSVADGKVCHFRPGSWATSANEIEISVWEGETITDGTPVVPVNQNRLKATLITSKTLCRTAPTVASLVGVRVGGPYHGGSGGNAQTKGGGSASGQDNEIVFLQDTWYVVQFENIGSTTATIAYYNLFWYEEDRG